MADASDRFQRTGAILLALAAIVGVSIGTRASLVASSANDAWQSAVRQEIKRAAGAVEDVRFVYVDEGPLAFDVARARIRAEGFRRAARRATGLERATLAVEAASQESYVTQIGKSVPDEYRTSKGGFDTAKRLADNRRKNPDLVGIDADVPQRKGDRLGRKAILQMTATIPAAIAFMLGAFAEAFGRRRVLLIAVGAVFLAGAAVLGLVFEFASV